jgi:hypothetical protein
MGDTRANPVLHVGTGHHVGFGCTDDEVGSVGERAKARELSSGFTHEDIGKRAKGPVQEEHG